MSITRIRLTDQEIEDFMGVVTALRIKSPNLSLASIAKEAQEVLPVGKRRTDMNFWLGRAYFKRVLEGENPVVKRTWNLSEEKALERDRAGKEANRRAELARKKAEDDRLFREKTTITAEDAMHHHMLLDKKIPVHTRLKNIEQHLQANQDIQRQLLGIFSGMKVVFEQILSTGLKTLTEASGINEGLLDLRTRPGTNTEVRISQSSGGKPLRPIVVAGLKESNQRKLEQEFGDKFNFTFIFEKEKERIKGLGKIYCETFFMGGFDPATRKLISQNVDDKKKIVDIGIRGFEELVQGLRTLQ